MKKLMPLKVSDQSGFIPMMLSIIAVIAFIIYLVYSRVASLSGS
jgi:hypothetical protein